MSSKNKNLSTNSEVSLTNVSKIKIGLVISKWNTHITSKLQNGCISHLKSIGITEENIKTIEVPGAFELAYGAKVLLNHSSYDAIICIGCVIKGETKHDEYINHATATHIQQLSLISNIPVIYGVLTPNDEQQAIDRSGGKYGNKGIEAANTALELISLNQRLKSSTSTIGFGK